MYARVAAATGWSFEYIGGMLTLPRLYALYRYWRDAPPIAESVAAFLGIKPAGVDDRPRAPVVGRITNADIVRDMRADPRLAKWSSDPTPPPEVLRKLNG